MYNKRVLSKIDLGKYSKPNPYSKDIITDPMGQWKYPGVPTRIPSSDITMQGVGYPVLGVANTGQTQMMMPGADYTFPGANYVDEYPQAKKGGLVKMPKPSKKGLASKKFTNSIMGTSRLFTESPLFAKPKKKKNRIFDPNAKYYQEGGQHIELELTPEEIEEYRRGGFIVEDISVPQLTMQNGGDPKPKKNKKEVKPLVTSNLKEYAKRKQAYDDSLKLYNASLEEYNLLKKTKGALEDSPFYTKEAYAAYKRLGYPEGYSMNVKRADNKITQAHFHEKPEQPVIFKKPVDLKQKQKQKQVKPFITSDPKLYAQRKAAYNDSLTLYNQGEKNYKQQLNFNKKYKIPNKSVQIENQPVEYKNNKLTKIQPIQSYGYYFNHDPDVVAGTKIPSHSVNDRVFRYKKPIQEVIFKPKEKQYPTSYKPVVNNTPKKLPEGKIQVGEEKVQQLDPNTGQVTTVINPIYEDAMLPMQTLQPRHVDNTLRKFVELPPETSEEEVIEDTEDTTYTEDAGEPGPGGHWEDNTSRYIDWDGNSIGFNGIRFRKPGHGGDLIRKGKRHYIHYPSIEKRYDAWIQPEEYQNGGMILELSDEEISEYQKGGWIVEEL